MEPVQWLRPLLSRPVTQCHSLPHVGRDADVNVVGAPRQLALGAGCRRSCNGFFRADQVNCALRCDISTEIRTQLDPKSTGGVLVELCQKQS